MKRLLTIALLLAVVLTAGAQGSWEVYHREADPMKGQDARDVYTYTAAGIGDVIVWDWKKADFRLITETGIFRSWIVNGDTYVPVKVGFYDENSKLVKMVVVNLFPEINSTKSIVTGVYYPGGRKAVREIVAHMKSCKGYVRFLVGKYNDSDFDMIVYPYEKK